jgi:16S rRNA (guanine1516-N2)-methyltransferase
MSVLAGDSKTLRAPAGTVIYLDPMFPERKKAAAVKKEAVMLQHLADQVDDGESLWQWAWDQPVERIVVKRPLRAPILGHIRPAHTLKGKSVRFDVFTRRLECS